MTCQWHHTSFRRHQLRRCSLIPLVCLAALSWQTGITALAQEKSKPESSQPAGRSADAPSPANQAARKWFQDARFGMFIHWGVYSVLGEGEWVMNEKKIPVSEYEKIPPQFNPTEFNPAEWVALAKAAGMKYITITSKHHDGFAMFDSKVSDYDIVDRTPYKKDVLKMLAEGQSVKDIAGTFELSVKTVEAHKFNLMRKLDIHNKAQLVQYAIQKKVIRIQELSLA